MNCAKPWLRVSFVAVTFVFGANVRAADELPLHGESVIRFAAPEQAATALSRKDAFLTAMSRFDLQSRLKTDSQVTAEDYGKFAAQQALPWQAADIERLTLAVRSLAERLRPLTLPLPKQVLLVKTTGLDEGDAAYCRANAVVLPKSKIEQLTPDRLERLLAHELFHVLSNQNPKLRRELYGIIGFRVIEPLKLPPELQNRKITNPDAPVLDCYLELEANGRKLLAAPLLIASVERYDVQRGGTFFKYLQFRLMEIELVEQQGRPVLNDGQPVLLVPQEIPSFQSQIGGNTNYIIHPDEILADNFVHLVFGTRGLATPRIVDEMRRILSAQEPGAAAQP